MNRELNKLKPSLGLFNVAGVFQLARWKKFKHDFNETCASIRILLEALREEYFADAKQGANKNKSIDKLSLYAKVFFKAFLRNRYNFQTRASRKFFQAYNACTNHLESWPAGSWETTSENFSLVVLDFRQLLGFLGKEEGTLEKSYFEMFMNIFLTIDFPMVTEPLVWLWICEDKEMELMACHLARHAMFTANYVKKYTTYKTTKFE